ncbi:hypothetical protein HK100_012880 [Physocladia obscura]|uniref:BTB domain-containing protein n=1 Tax=Physocladia obscura TaxID=109957 RepID=A0AAD5XHM2_9FUNG|nr:hypothetical protein HK100_012880 [Physocladia obscura]
MMTTPSQQYGNANGNGTANGNSNNNNTVLASGHDMLAGHLYHVGFVGGHHSDMILRVQLNGSAATANTTSAHATNPNTAGAVTGGEGSVPPSAAAAAVDVSVPVSVSAADGAPSAAPATTAGAAPPTPPVEAVFKLHKLLAVRSPVLAAMLHDAELRNAASSSEGFVSSPILEISLVAADPSITHEGLSIALGSLYADYSRAILAANHLDPRLLKSVLSAAIFLLLPDLAATAADLIKRDISRASLKEYCAFVSNSQQQQHHHHLSDSSPTSSIANSASPVGSGAPSGSPLTTSWILEIRDAIFVFLCKGLAREISEKTLTPQIWGNKSGDAYRDLVAAFSELPFEWLKKVIESTAFDVPNDMERFSFAKEVVARRARKHRESSGKDGLVAGEENVLMSFGSGRPGASGVTIVRKAVKLPTPQQQHLQQQIQQQQQQQQQQYQQQQYLQYNQQQQYNPHLSYSVVDQYSELQQQLYLQQNLVAQGYAPQERRVWKAGN